jgi:addiction module RelE/StbE family toxin
MWKVLESKTARKQLSKVPKEILESFEFWKSVAEYSGPLGIRAIPGFKDHALKGQWAGSRASRLSLKWRVIYFVRGEEFLIYIEEVNPHDYR